VTRDRLLTAVLASRPEHYFDAVRAELDQVVQLQCDIHDLVARQRRTKLGSPRSIALAQAAGDRLGELAPLWEALHFAPDQKRLPPPRSGANVIPLPAARSDRAKKQRNYRRRQANGLAVLRIAVKHHELVAALISAGRMSDTEALDRGRVERQVSRLLEEWRATWNR
jgi:hypothetical protein